MNKEMMRSKLALALLGVFAAIGCSRQTPDPATSASGRPPAASQEMAAAEDKRAEGILRSSDIMEARDWVRRYPKSLFSPHAIAEDGQGGTPLGPVVERLFSAGAQRVVVHHANRARLLGVVVVLPEDASARQKIFALEPELSQLCQQKQARDVLQKYLYYTPD
jgi:hypothetical protein